MYMISSCTRLQNYMTVYTNMAAVTKFIAKNNKSTTSAILATLCKIKQLSAANELH